jgi:hypothetical protein
VLSTRLSTTTSREHAARYAELNAGEIYIFEVPRRRLYELQAEGKVFEARDLLVGTTESAVEYRFVGSAAEELNLYIVVPE